MADYSAMIQDAFSYTKEGVYHRTDRWMRLILATILLGIPLYGYTIRIYRGAVPAPDVDDWKTLFIEGLTLLVICLIYAIPIFILAFAPALLMPAPVAGPVGSVHTMPDGGLVKTLAIMLVSMVLTLIFEIIIAILLPIASIRFARTCSFSEAFDFRTILAHIGKIGWLNYILALILFFVIIGIPVFILEMIFLVGGLVLGNMYIGLGLFIVLVLIFAPVVTTFQARYTTQVYDLGVSDPAEQVQ
jgi:hypothetical protein